MTDRNEERANQGNTALLAYAEEIGVDIDTEGFTDTMTDLLTDLRHLVEATGEDWEAFISRVEMHHEAEAPEPTKPKHWYISADFRSHDVYRRDFYVEASTLEEAKRKVKDGEVDHVGEKSIDCEGSEFIAFDDDRCQEDIY